MLHGAMLPLEVKTTCFQTWMVWMQFGELNDNYTLHPQFCSYLQCRTSPAQGPSTQHVVWIPVCREGCAWLSFFLLLNFTFSSRAGALRHIHPAVVAWLSTYKDATSKDHWNLHISGIHSCMFVALTGICFRAIPAMSLWRLVYKGRVHTKAMQMKTEH